jgi:C-terminal processing protease CtpA/Prc
MVLNFKQSKKVTLFGENTMGAADYLDFYPIEISDKYTLFMPTSKRIFNDSRDAIDGVGIKPNIYLIGDEEYWLKSVCQYYEQK